MMKKTGAGWLWFCAVVTGLNLTLTASAQETAAVPAASGPQAAGAETSAPDTPGPAAQVPTELETRLAVLQRMEAFKSADLDALQAAQTECMKKAEELAESIPELRRQLNEAYEDARLNSPEAKALRQQIRDLEARLEQTLVENPAVQEKQKAIDQVQKDMLTELQVRTQLGALIAAREGRDPARTPE